MAPSTLRGRADSARSRQTRPSSLAAAERAAAKRAARQPGPADPEVVAETPGSAQSTEAVDAAGSAETVDTAEVSEAAEPPAEGQSRRPGLLLAGLAAALIAALVTAALQGVQYRDAERTGQARNAAVAAARTAAPVIFSYDYRHLDADFAAASGYLTGAFRSQYAKTTATVVKPTAEQYHGVVKATVAAPPNGGDPAAAVVSAQPDQVVVLLFVDQTSTSTEITGTHLDQNRVRMTMVRTAEGWKVSAVDAL
jgi:Mce-associated membrane protein